MKATIGVRFTDQTRERLEAIAASEERRRGFGRVYVSDVIRVAVEWFVAEIERNGGEIPTVEAEETA